MSVQQIVRTKAGRDAQGQVVDSIAARVGNLTPYEVESVGVPSAYVVVSRRAAKQELSLK